MTRMTCQRALQIVEEHLIAGRIPQAEAVCRIVLASAPDNAEAHRFQGVIAQLQGQGDLARRELRRAVELDPTSGLAQDNLGVVLLELGDFEEAEAAARAAIRLLPEDAATRYGNLGSVLLAQGRVDDALAAFQRAMADGPVQPSVHTSYLRCLGFRPGVSPAELLARHVEWDRLHAAALRSEWPVWTNDRHPDRRLRVGFSSPDLGSHPVGLFLLGPLECLSRQEFEIYCYSDRVRHDHVTARYQHRADVWREVSSLCDAALAQQIRADGIDILFDLAGHTGRSRLLTFARKPAPVQVSWLGYVGTTGLEAMDYLLADAFEVSPAAEPFCRERVLRMPHDYICYTPPADAPAIGPLPARRCGHVTLGCFNSPSKLNRPVIALWSSLLHRLPQARMMLQYKGMGHGPNRRRLEALFAEQGIEPSRLDMLDWTDRLELMSHYNLVDIALDPFPFSGGLTTCEALWMGVPVITCPGETFASRHSLSHASNAGFPHLAVRNLNEYAEAVVALAHDLPRLEALRAELRPRMARSPLCDPHGFAADLGRLLRDIWQRWAAAPILSENPNLRSPSPAGRGPG